MPDYKEILRVLVASTKTLSKEERANSNSKVRHTLVPVTPRYRHS